MQVLQTLAGTVGVLRLLYMYSQQILYRVPDIERAQIFETVNWSFLTYERGHIFGPVNRT